MQPYATTVVCMFIMFSSFVYFLQGKRKTVAGKKIAKK